MRRSASLSSRVLALASVVLGGCVQTPPPEFDGVGISEIVQRIKCELAEAMPARRGSTPYGEFQWLQNWTARVDLLLQTTDTSSINPNMSFIKPLLVSGTSFNTGLSGTAQGIAFREDKVSFTVSVVELTSEEYRGLCEPTRKRGLLGNLGLGEWVTSALAPVQARQLTIGFHQSPTGKGAQIPPPTVPMAAAPTHFAAVIAKLHYAEQLAETARRAGARAKKLVIERRFEAAYRAINTTYGLVERVNGVLDEAKTLQWREKRALLDASDKHELTQDDGKLVQSLNARAQEITDQASAAQKTGAASWALMPKDAPLDAIVHTTRFTVTTNLNVTPNWLLVQYKGPGNAGNFFSAERKRYHNLDITMGPSADPGGKALSDEQQRQLLNLRLDALRQLTIPIIQ